MTQYVTQDQFATLERYSNLQAGTYTVEYTDSTHLKPDAWRSLLTITVGAPAHGIVTDAERSFEISTDIHASIQGDARKVVLDVLSLSATRLGLIAPVISGRTAEQLAELRKSRGLVLIPDTNSLYNGTLHWLLSVLRDSAVWLLPFVMSLTQMQSRDATLKSMYNKQKEGNLSQALRSRAFVNAGLGLLERNHHRYQVMELDPSLLRYMRMGGRGGADPDEGEVLEDRLLIEGVHSILRSTRTRAGQLVVTSDVLLARILGAEGIPNLYLPSPKLGENAITSVRYDAWARCFVGTTVKSLLWDLTHAFGSIALAQKGTRVFDLNCYWAGKSPQDWLEEKLRHEEASSAAGQPVPTEAVDKGPSEATPKAVVVNKDGAPPVQVEPSFSEAALPQSSLPLALQLAAVVYSAGKAKFPNLLSLMRDQRPNEGNARRSLEVVRRARLIDFDGAFVTPRVELDAVDSDLRAWRLDGVSAQLRNFKPYDVVLAQLAATGQLERSEVQNLLEKALGDSVAGEASVRLVRYHVLLGQCWTDGKLWRDGSQRPSDKQFVDAFGLVFDRVAHDNVARMSDFVPAMCRELRMSPWATERYAQRLSRLLSEEYAFQYAVGGKPTGVDQVLRGSLVALEEVPVPLDRLEIGGRPILTVGRVR